MFSLILNICFIFGLILIFAPIAIVALCIIGMFVSGILGLGE